MDEENYPISSYLKERLDAQIKRVFVKGLPSLIIIDGISGGGKTTLAVECAEYIEKKEINLNEYIGMGIDGFREKLPVAVEKKNKCIIFDEAGEYDKRTFAQKFNFELNKIWDRYRTFKIIPILCLPLFEVLDNRLFDKGIPRLLFHVYPDKRTNSRRLVDVFSHYKMMWLKFNMSKNPIKRSQYKYPNNPYPAYFYDLKPERSKELDNLSTKEKKISTFQENKSLKQNGYKSRRGLSKEINKPFLKVERTITQLNIEPDFVDNSGGFWYKKEKCDIIKNALEKKEISTA